MQRIQGHAGEQCGITAVRRYQGFTLIELVVAISVLAIIVAMAVPSFTSLINSNRLATNANELVASVQLAKMESLRRNMRVGVCESSNGTICTDGDNWAQWITIADVDRDGDFDASDDVLRVSTAKIPVQVRVSAAIGNNGNRIEFRADGLARDAVGALLNADIGVCIPTTQPAENQRLIGIGSGSRISTTRNDAGGACATP